MMTSFSHTHLNEWLNTIRTSHRMIIDYSLNRIQSVAQHLKLLHPIPPVITVTGTNGKGSTVYAMEAILKVASYQVGVFTSPYLETFNEQIRLNGHPATDDQLIQAFTIIHEACVQLATNLTEFEFLTLAALFVFKHNPLDIIILEVGLGGGNDAVAIVSPDVTVITSIALDHEDYLGHTVDAIAFNEAQLLPPGKTGIIGLQHAPQPLIDHAIKIQASLLHLEKDFCIEQWDNHWTFKNNSVTYNNLPYPNILIQNAALAIQTLLSTHVLLSEDILQTAFQHIPIKGRLQWIPGKPSYLIDVSHNIEGVTQLAHGLQSHHNHKIIAVFSALSDKPIAQLIALINPFVEHWHIAPISHLRTASTEQLLTAFSENHIPPSKISVHLDLPTACETAYREAQDDHLILAFGSFFVARATLTAFSIFQK